MTSESPMSPGGTQRRFDTLDSVVWVQDLMRLKARYCRYLDTKDWDSWRTLFADDFVSDTSSASGAIIEGAGAFVDFVRESVGDRATVHQVHAPDLDITSDTTAHGYWALHDIVQTSSGARMDGYGHYEDFYTRVNGTWLFARSVLTRVRVDLTSN